MKYLENKKYRWTIIAVFLTGIFAHGYMFTNKISFHDDIGCLFSVGATYSSGRWGLGIIEKILSFSIGKYSLSLWGGNFFNIYCSYSMHDYRFARVM